MRRFYNKWDQAVGTLQEGVFRKVVSQKKHLFKSEDGWGIDESILNELPPKTEVRILDKDENVVYTTTKEIFQTHSKVDFGHGVQVIMWRKHFDTIKDGITTKSEYVSRWLADCVLFDEYKSV